MASAALSVDASIARLDLAGPLDAGLVNRLAELCARVADDEAVRVLVLSADAATWAGWSAQALDRAAADGLIGDPLRPLADLPQPTIVALAGTVRDGGLELALCADLRVAGVGSSFALAATESRAWPIAGGLQRLARLVGRARAQELALLGDPIDAATALQWGLVSAVADDPPAEALRRAALLAARGPIAIRLAKEAVRRGAEMPLDQALRYETDLTVLLQTTEDRAEGVSAFLEKRAPHFRGR